MSSLVAHWTSDREYVGRLQNLTLLTCLLTLRRGRPALAVAPSAVSTKATRPSATGTDFLSPKCTELANCRWRIALGRRPALRISRYLRYGAEKQSGAWRGGMLVLVPCESPVEVAS